MYQEKDHSLFGPFLARFKEFVQTRQGFFKHGIIEDINYTLHDLAVIAHGNICSVVRNACFNESWVTLDQFGVFAATDKEFTFVPDSYLTQQVCYGLTISSPKWVDTYGQRKKLDSKLLIAILELELQNMAMEEYVTIAVVTYNGLIRAMTWFLAQRKPVVISGLGAFKVDKSGAVQYDPNKIIKDTIGLKRRVEEKHRSQTGRIVDLGTESMPADMVERDIKERQTLAEKVKHLVAGIESSGVDQATRDDQIMAGFNKLLEEEFGEGFED